MERSHGSEASGGVTVINVTAERLEPAGKRFGINLGEQAFYGSGQMMKNLVFRNPGFEGMEYRSIARCRNARGHFCEDANAWAQGFWSGADFRFLSGKNMGNAGRLAAFESSPARFTFAANVYPNSGEYFELTKSFPGDPAAGWWTSVDGHASFAAEFHDLSPHTAGKQALRIDASAPGSAARLNSYFDTYADGHPNETPRSFLRMHGGYELRFRAKAVAGRPEVEVEVDRQGTPAFLKRTISLTPAWQDYSVSFNAEDDASNTHAVELQFAVAGAAILLDDASLIAAGDEAGNPTAFRLPVVHALQQFHPGVLRLMQSRTQLGSAMANLLAAPEARARSGYSASGQKQEDIAIGIPEFLELCALVGAEPWITLPTATSPAEAAMLVRYLSEKHWIERFPAIHLELGNEAWNSVFAGETIEDSAAYGQYAETVFRAMRATPGFQANKFDLVAGGQSEWPERNRQILQATGASADSLAIAPYIWRKLLETSDDNAMFQHGMAEPEQMDLHGEVHENAAIAGNAAHPAKLEVYEVNLHTTEGTATEQQLDAATPSFAGGLAVAAHMLEMRRDDGVQTQMLFNLPEFKNGRPDGKSIRLWGSVVDMGPSERKRPVFQLLTMVNQVAEGAMLRTAQSGADPRIGDAKTGNPTHAIQSYAFDLGGNLHEKALILLNLDSAPHKVTLPGISPGSFPIRAGILTAPPAANNEDSAEIAAKTVNLAAAEMTLQPYCLAVLRWREQH